jgi:hypothetical protein
MSAKMFNWMLALVSSLPLTCAALGLGEIKVNSPLYRSFDAEIEVLKADSEELANLKVGMADNELFSRYGLDRPAYLSGFNFAVTHGRDGHALIKVTSNGPVTEPFVTLLVLAESGHRRHLREYSVMLEPPPPQVRHNELDAPGIAPTRDGVRLAIKPTPRNESSRDDFNIVAVAINPVMRFPEKIAWLDTETATVTLDRASMLSMLKRAQSRKNAVGTDKMTDEEFESLDIAMIDLSCICAGTVSVDPVDRQPVRKLTDQFETEWAWKLTGHKLGTKQRLRLQVFSVPDGNALHSPVQAWKHDISVDVIFDPLRTIPIFLAEHWQWFAGAFILAPLGFILRRYAERASGTGTRT